MNNRRSNFLNILSNEGIASLSILVLLICLFYAYAITYSAPYPGVTIGPDLTVQALEPCGANTTWCESNKNTLQVGDQLLVIGDLTYAEAQRDRSRIPFARYNPGDVVSITLRRAGEERTVGWQMLGPTTASQIRRLSETLLVFIPFWLAGTVLLLFLQPRDLRWRLLIIFTYVTAIWLAVGVYSDLRVTYASLVQHAFAWMLASVALHLHLNVPSSLLRHHQRYFLPFLYAVAIILAVLELFQMLPSAAFNLSLLLGFLGSFGILVFRLLAKSSASDKIAVRLMLFGISLALGPGIVLAVIPALLKAHLPGGLALDVSIFAIPLLPFFYIYAVYKRYLGNMEFRANRLLSLYSFVLLYTTAFILVYFFGGHRIGLPESSMVLNLAVLTAFIIAAPPLRNRFQRLVDHLAYGVEYNPDDIIQVFADQIPRASNSETLIQLLADELTSSLLIRQSALYLLTDGDANLVFARGVRTSETPDVSHKIQRLSAEAGRYRQLASGAQDEFDWVRLVILLEVRKEMVGVWLFGRRDPDDYYSQNDITLLTTLASQVAVAVENARLYSSLLESNTRLQEALQAKDEMIQNVSHELRTPLAIMMGYIELLKEGTLGLLTPELKRIVTVLDRQSERLHFMVQRLLTLQTLKPEVLQKVPLELEPWLRGVVQPWTARAAEAGVELCLDVSSDLPSLMADPDLLEQVVVNLLDNAIKFSPGGGTITVRASIAPASYLLSPVPSQAAAVGSQHSAVVIAVTDQGIGIPPDKLEMVFGRFYQVDASTTRQFGGMGIGLALCQKIVEIHCGRIWAESEGEGQGSTFYVALPVICDEAMGTGTITSVDLRGVNRISSGPPLTILHS